MIPKPSEESILRGVSVILRVPALFIAEAWYRTDPKTAIHYGTSMGAVDHDGRHQVFIKTIYYSSKILYIEFQIAML